MNTNNKEWLGAMRYALEEIALILVFYNQLSQFQKDVQKI